MITYNSGKILSHITVTKFPSGEVGVKLSQPVTNWFEVSINAFIKNSDDVMCLLQTVDAMRHQNPAIKIHLKMPYVPYARQDRVCNEGEALSIRVFASLINSCKLVSVEITEPHSDVTSALINNCLVKESHEIFRSIYPSWHDVYITAPDAGATKRCEKFAKHVGAAGVVQCLKKRDTKTGELSGFTCLDDVTGKHLLVLDDICDGGGTFVGLANELYAAKRLDLAVVHGIFTKGTERLASMYENIYTTSSYYGEIPENLKINENVIWL